MEDTLEKIVEKYRRRGGNIIFLLQETQESFGHIPKKAVDFFSEELGIPSSKIYGVATFYSQFRLDPLGENKVVACCGTACHVKGSERIISGLRRELGLRDGKDTTEDKKVTLEEVACLGTCSFAPVVLINGNVRGKANLDTLIKEVRTLRKQGSE